VSVLLPTHQRRRHSLQAVASVLAQTRPDFELIVVDDGSSDGTGEALKGLDPRLVYSWQPNRGVAAARNAALRMARAPVVAFLDSDDSWRPHHLESVLGLLERHPRAPLVATWSGQTAGSRTEERLFDAMPRVLLGGCVGYTCCVAARRAELVAVGGFDERLLVGEDSDLWARLALRGPFCLAPVCSSDRSPAPGSLSELGRLRGLYPHRWLHTAKRLGAELERECGRDRRRLAPKVRGFGAWGRAMIALLDEDPGEAGAALREACRLFPELSESSAAVLRRTAGAHPRWHVEEERLRVAATLAELWPEPLSPTGLAFRALAQGTAPRRARSSEPAPLAL